MAWWTHDRWLTNSRTVHFVRVITTVVISVTSPVIQHTFPVITGEHTGEPTQRRQPACNRQNNWREKNSLDRCNLGLELGDWELVWFSFSTIKSIKSMGVKTHPFKSYSAPCRYKHDKLTEKLSFFILICFFFTQDIACKLKYTFNNTVTHAVQWLCVCCYGSSAGGSQSCCCVTSCTRGHEVNAW